MSFLSRVWVPLVFTGVLTACTSQSSSFVNETLYPSNGAPAAYLVGSIGPMSASLSPAINQRLLFRKRGSEYGAAAIWAGKSGGTPQDIKDQTGSASVFVLKLKPGDYELYDFQLLYTRYAPGGGTTFTSTQSREKLNVPLRLQAGKAYYLGEFRSKCLNGSFCSFLWRDQLSRDELFARQQAPDLPELQLMNLDFTPAIPFILPVTAHSQTGKDDSAER